MGSLVPSWDSNTPGVPPKGWQDYEEPLSPRGARIDPAHGGQPLKQGELSRQLSRQMSGPPNLSRASAPGRSLSLERSRSIDRSYSLERRSSLASPSALGRSVGAPLVSPSSPRSPGSPRACGSVGSAPSRFLARYWEMNEGPAEDIKKTEKWCDRLDSHVLNERPDEGDEMEWRHGHYKPQHEVARSHLPGVKEVERPEVTVERVSEGLKRISVDAVHTPTTQPRGNGRDISPSP